MARFLRSHIPLLLAVLLSLLLGAARSEDPCSVASTLHSASLRTKSSSSVYSVCDIRLNSSSWVRVSTGSGSDLVTSCPFFLGGCGTPFPVWLNGTIPDVIEGEVTRTACQTSLHSCCEQELTVGVKNCGNFRVWRLPPTLACPQAYCFEDPLPLMLTTSSKAPSFTTTTPPYFPGPHPPQDDPHHPDDHHDDHHDDHDDYDGHHDNNVPNNNANLNDNNVPNNNANLNDNNVPNNNADLSDNNVPLNNAGPDGNDDNADQDSQVRDKDSLEGWEPEKRMRVMEAVLGVVSFLLVASLVFNGVLLYKFCARRNNLTYSKAQEVYKVPLKNVPPYSEVEPPRAPCTPPPPYQTKMPAKMNTWVEKRELPRY